MPDRVHRGPDHEITLGNGRATATFRIGDTVATVTLERGRLDTKIAGAKIDSGPISSVEMAGIRLADRVIAFEKDLGAARGPVSFSVDGPAKLKIYAAALAQGTWEIWWNGWLEHPGESVSADSGVLAFEGPAGSYFFRRL